MEKADLLGTGVHLNSFLRLGFFLDYRPKLTLDLSSVDPERYAGTHVEDLLRRQAELFRAAVVSRFESHRRHLIPLSGGLDSRAILAVLVECTEARNLHTCTFGTPGTYDYDLGCQVAQRLGTLHACYPLTEHVYTLAELLDVSSRIEHQTILFHHPPLADMERRFGGHVVWSGFLGDKLALPPETTVGDEQAKLNFLGKNTYVRSTDLTRPGGAELSAALAIQPAVRSRLLLEEELNLRYRQLKFIAPHVLAAGFDYRTPFLDRELVDFMLSVPLSMRRGARFYRQFLSRTFPGLFDLGTKANEGLPLGARKPRVLYRKVRRKLQGAMGTHWTRGLDPMLNYLDFGPALRSRPDLRNLVSSSLADLEKRRVVDWIDLGSLWKRHLTGAVDHSDALIVLTSLEIHLKAGMKL